MNATMNDDFYLARLEAGLAFKAAPEAPICKKLRAYTFCKRRTFCQNFFNAMILHSTLLLIVIIIGAV